MELAIPESVSHRGKNTHNNKNPTFVIFNIQHTKTAREEKPASQDFEQLNNVVSCTSRKDPGKYRAVYTLGTLSKQPHILYFSVARTHLWTQSMVNAHFGRIFHPLCFAAS